MGDDPSRDDDDPVLGDGLDDDAIDDAGLDDIDAPPDDADLDAMGDAGEVAAAPVDDGRAEGPAGAEPARPAPGPLAGNPAVNLPVFAPGGDEG